MFAVVMGIPGHYHSNDEPPAVALLGIGSAIGLLGVPVWGIVSMFRARSGKDLLPILRLARSQGFVPHVVIGQTVIDIERRAMSIGRNAFFPLADATGCSFGYQQHGQFLAVNVGGAFIPGSLPSMRDGYYIEINTRNYDAPKLTWQVARNQLEALQIWSVFQDVMSGAFSMADIARLPKNIGSRSREARDLYASL